MATTTNQVRYKKCERRFAQLSNFCPRHEIVITTLLSEVEDLQGKSTPFLRVITAPEDLADFQNRLLPLGEDIEVVFLGEWIPKKK